MLLRPIFPSLFKLLLLPLLLLPSLLPLLPSVSCVPSPQNGVSQHGHLRHSQNGGGLRHSRDGGGLDHAQNGGGQSGHDMHPVKHFYGGDTDQHSDAGDLLSRVTRDTKIFPLGPGRKEDQAFWRRLGQQDILDSLARKPNTNKAKNVILFLGDGLSLPTIAAARIYKGQVRQGVSGEEVNLLFEDFPHVALAKTYNVDSQVADSAATATAFLSGVKTNYKLLGVDSSVRLGDCSSMTDTNKLDSIAQWALDGGRLTGFVTTTRITHATPGALYAHTAHRNWECDGKVPNDQKLLCPTFKDIARQLVEDQPGRDFHVVMGGGYQCLSATAVDQWEDPIDNEACTRLDGRDLFQQWQDQKAAEGKRFAAVRSKSELMDLDLNGVEHLLGVFANDHIPWDSEIKAKKLDIPTLAEMTSRAIDMLSQHPQGFFLLVEGGRIDHGHHNNTALRALDETVALDDAVAVALNKLSTEDTMIVVTADHSHVMSFNGYPKRGQDIRGFGGVGADGFPYTTLMYTNGPGFSYSHYNETHGGRFNLSSTDVTDFNYKQLSGVPKSSETHGGDDVAIYATGPMAHLFHGLHEQNYIAHAMAYAACIGANTDHCSGVSGSSPLRPPRPPVQLWAFFVLLVFCTIALHW